MRLSSFSEATYRFEKVVRIPHDCDIGPMIHVKACSSHFTLHLPISTIIMHMLLLTTAPNNTMCSGDHKRQTATCEHPEPILEHACSTLARDLYQFQCC